MFPVVDEAEDNRDDHEGEEDSKTDPSHPGKVIPLGFFCGETGACGEAWRIIAMLNHGDILSTKCPS